MGMVFPVFQRVFCRVDSCIICSWPFHFILDIDPNFSLYSVTFGLNMVTISLWFSPLPPVYHSIVNPSNIALESVMACRVFRGLRLGLIEPHGETVTRSYLLKGVGTMTDEYARKSIALDPPHHDPFVESTKISESA